MDKDPYITLEKRRSVYALSKELPVPEDRIREIVEYAAKHSPSPFNSQTPRMVVLFGKEHDALWNIVLESLRKVVPADQFAETKQKIDMFGNAYGTVLFFEESATTDGLANQFPLYSSAFPVWAQQANGMVQYAVWTLLANENIGASLQHYNPLIDEDVRKRWNIPASWKLAAQMPFGKIIAPAGEKTFLSIEERVKVFK